MQKATLWITGATGFLGGHFLYHVLRNSDTRVVAVVRPRRGEHARERLLQALELVADSYREPFDARSVLPNLHIVEGDITEPACGVGIEGVSDALRAGPCAFWHMAASLNFEDKFRDQIHLLNVEGTRNALALAEQLDAQRFIYVSTAYTCGKFVGEVPETLHSLDGEFNNVYERTKCEAEHLAARWGERSGRAVSILRPSVVVGPKRTHLPGGSDTGLYGFTREIYRLRRMLQSSKAGLRLRGQEHAPLNLVAVDEVASEMWSHAEAGFPGGLVHHLTSEEQPNIAALFSTVTKHCDVPEIRAVDDEKLAKSPVEEVMDRRATFYASYLRDPKWFARARGKHLKVSDGDLDDYVREYVRVRRHATAGTAFARELIADADERPLTTFSTGRAGLPTVVFCNAYGVPSDVWVPLANALKHDYRLLTWELRGDMDEHGEAAGPEAHVADLGRVLDHYGVQSAYLIGWCTGADLAMLFATMHPNRVRAAVSLCGALNNATHVRTSFQRNLAKLVAHAARDLRRAELYHESFFGAQRPHYGAVAAGSTGEEPTLSSLVDSLDPSLLHLTSAPFRDPLSLHRYARSMGSYYRYCEQHPLCQVSVPSLLIAGGRDEIAHPEASRRAATRWQRARLLELPEADHFSLYQDPTLAASIRTFVAETECARGGAGAVPGELPARAFCEALSA